MAIQCTLVFVLEDVETVEQARAEIQDMLDAASFDASFFEYEEYRSVEA